MHRLPAIQVRNESTPVRNQEQEARMRDHLVQILQDRQGQIHQRKVHRIPPNSKVRRRLFPEENLEEQARIDNFANKLQELAALDKQEKYKKWAFDFENEVPLDGDYEWYYKKDKNEWIGMKTKAEDLEGSNDKSPLKQVENETTPIQVRDETVPVIRKRRRNIENGIGNQAKRKVDFDECSFSRRRRSE